MRKTLLVSVAAFALAAGGNLAFSQGGGGSGGGTGSPSMQQSPSGGSGAGMSGGAGTNQSGGARSEQPSAGSAQTETAPGGQKGSKQGQTERRDGSKQGTNERREGGSKQGASEREGGTRQGASETKGGSSTTTRQGAATGGMNSKSVSLTSEQKTTIRQTVLTGSAPRVNTVNFDVRVGTVVPRSVHIVPLPATIVDIEPTWRGYMYFVYHDEIVVVEPGTLRIVAVLEV